MFNKEKKYRLAIELRIHYPETLEERLLSIFYSLSKSDSNISCLLTSLESTGSKGILLSERLEEAVELQVTIDEIIEVLKEDGQVFELNLLIKETKFNSLILISDGRHVNIVSDKYSLGDNTIVGDFRYIDLSLFNNAGNLLD